MNNSNINDKKNKIQFSGRKRKYNNCISKIKFIVCLFFGLFLISYFKVSKVSKISKESIEEQLEKELNQIAFKKTRLNWYNIRNDFIFLSQKYRYLIKSEKNISEFSPIWVMWYQGIERAPPIVKSCIQSIIENRANHPVHIINKNNLEKYIKLPSYIKEKFNKRRFSLTHLCDIIRMGILVKYGGYWIDSTYLITAPIPKVNTSFYSLRLKYCFRHPIINCQWAINFMAVPQNSFIATYCYIALLFYLKKYNYFISYYLLDYIVRIAYGHVPEFRKLITNLPFMQCSILSFVNKLNHYYKPTDFQCNYNKLTRKRIYYSFWRKRMTNYGYIIRKYKLNYTIISNNTIS